MQTLESLVLVRPAVVGWQFSEDGKQWRALCADCSCSTAGQALETATRLFPEKMIAITSRRSA